MKRERKVRVKGGMKMREKSGKDIEGRESETKVIKNDEGKRENGNEMNEEGRK